MKTCKVCGEAKPLAAFHRCEGCRDGVRPECKDCYRVRQRERYLENPRKHIDRVLRWQRENRERYLDRQRAYRRTPAKKLANRKSHLKRTYGITLDEYDAMLAAQGGGCALCGDPGHEVISLHVDHDHESGAVRGLLCFRCNNALGDLRESSDVLYRAAEYLDRDEELAGRVRTRALALGGARGRAEDATPGAGAGGR